MTRTSTAPHRHFLDIVDEGARALCDGLADISTRAGVLAGDLAGIRGDSSSRPLVLASVSTRAGDLAGALARAGDLANELARTCGRTRKLAGERARALADDLAGMSGIAKGLADMSDQASDAPDGFGVAGVRALATGFARDVAVIVHRARELARLFLDDGAGAPGPPKRRDTGAAGRLVTVAGRLLPPADRPRYLEEFRAELWDLAEAGTGRWGQVAHAVRLLSRALGLRRELKVPHPRKASW